MRVRLGVCLCALACSAAVCAPAGADDRKDAPAKKAEPAPGVEGAVRKLEAAARAGEVEAFLACLADAPRKAIKDLFDALASLDKARKAFDAALDEKFGKAPASAKPADVDAKTFLAGLSRIEVVSQEPRGDERVEMRVKTTAAGADGRPTTREEKLIAVREKAVWKLIPGRLEDAKAFESARQFIVRQAVALDKVGKAVRQGKYADRAKATAAAAEALVNEQP